MNSKNYYEVHVTMTEGSTTRQLIEDRVKSCDGWRFSAIDGDTNLGDGVKMYATKQYNGKHPVDTVVGWLLDMGIYMRAGGAHVVREKVEIVVYDTRSSKVQCLDCATCQEAR